MFLRPFLVNSIHTSNFASGVPPGVKDLKSSYVIFNNTGIDLLKSVLFKFCNLSVT